MFVLEYLVSIESYSSSEMCNVNNYLFPQKFVSFVWHFWIGLSYIRSDHAYHFDLVWFSLI